MNNACLIFIVFFSLVVLLIIAVLVPAFLSPKYLEEKLDIHDAAYNGDVNTLNELLAENPQCIDLKTTSGRTPLYFAISEGHLAATETLIEAGADLSIKYPPNESSVLSISVFQGDVTIIDFLLSCNVDVNIKNVNGQTALHEAAFYGNEQIVRSLISASADVFVKDNNDKTPLDIARHRQVKEEILEMLKETKRD